MRHSWLQRHVSETSRHGSMNITGSAIMTMRMFMYLLQIQLLACRLTLCFCKLA